MDGYTVNLCVFCFYRITGKLTDFFQLQEFIQRNHTFTSAPPQKRIYTPPIKVKVPVFGSVCLLWIEKARGSSSLFSQNMLVNFFFLKNHKQHARLGKGFSNADTDMQVLFIAGDVALLIGQGPRSCTTDHIWLWRHGNLEKTTCARTHTNIQTEHISEHNLHRQRN